MPKEKKQNFSTVEKRQRDIQDRILTIEKIQKEIQDDIKKACQASDREII